MEPTIMFRPGAYYVGDIAHVLQEHDLRTTLYEVLSPTGLQTGVKDLIVSGRPFDNGTVFEQYFVAKTLHLAGTLYDSNNNSYGFDFGMFGCVPWEWVEHKGGYENHKVTFTEPFDCSCTEDSVTIGHLHFTLNPK